MTDWFNQDALMFSSGVTLSLWGASSGVASAVSMISRGDTDILRSSSQMFRTVYTWRSTPPIVIGEMMVMFALFA